MCRCGWRRRLGIELLDAGGWFPASGFWGSAVALVVGGGSNNRSSGEILVFSFGGGQIAGRLVKKGFSGCEIEKFT